MEQSSKAYKEVYEILKHIPKRELEKVPESLKKFFERNMDKDYEYKLNNIKDLKSQEMQKETKVILSILYRDYWATPEEKEEIIKRDARQIKDREEQLRKMYDMDNIFAKRAKEEEIQRELANKKQGTDIVKYEENFFKRVLSKVRGKVMNLFNKKNGGI